MRLFLLLLPWLGGDLPSPQPASPPETSAPAPARATPVTVRLDPFVAALVEVRNPYARVMIVERAAALTVLSDADQARYARALEHAAAVTALLQSLHTDGLSPEEVERARRILLGEEEEDLHSPAEALFVSLERLLDQQGQRPQVDLYKLAHEVPFAEVDAFARDFYDPAAFSQVRVSPRAGHKALAKE